MSQIYNLFSQTLVVSSGNLNFDVIPVASKYTRLYSLLYAADLKQKCFASFFIEQIYTEHNL